MDTPAYDHLQYLPMPALVLPLAAPVLSMALAGPALAEALPAIALAATVALLALLLMGRLRVRLDAQQLQWDFGWLSVPRWRLALADVAAVEVGRSRWYEGWGINRTRQGMLYNVRGFGAVRLQLRDGRVIRLGSDEPERLCAYLQARLPRR